MPRLDTIRQMPAAALLAAATMVTLSCGVAELDGADDIEESGGRETYFRHGTPPGPAPWTYVLTSYSGGTMACGGQASGGYYATGAYTFGCGSKLRIEANGKCVVVKVSDNGPAGWVESKAKNRCGGTGYVIDASPLVSRHLFGTSSAGWSDCFHIQVSEVPASTPVGPCGPSAGALAKGFIGDACSDASDCSTGLCLTEADGFPGGTCSQPCSSLCPDQPGKAITFCTNLDGAPRCVSRCEQSTCREGYRCVTMPRWNDQDVEHEVCLPE
jgi:hypothetical protein